ncbi:hypothetical protein BMR1_02g03810 [Babesia microti strain RI]|uniref:EF-hand domain-containing protein n=1 Tax=Babesia microti (strain RI) TaxID=1133968 RepID=I7J6M3_BABMR|nr:hypothetical protein BMR1_02g03810 [Babesia microti strain RI]CCF73912.1 hypothetical protein BMR1_02g03810 [Babesia microti strain RI]|eukprot:XP_012648521.1 hypothetical protein BMR1_02g03810 [Babesia microti strain RI]
MLDKYKFRAAEIFNLYAKSFCKISGCNHLQCGHPKVIKVDDYVNLARMFGLLYTSSDIISFNSRIKTAGITHLTLENFIELLEIKLKSSKQLNITSVEKLLRNSYSVLDYQGQGKINSSDLKHMLASLNNGELNPTFCSKLITDTIKKNPRFITQDNFVNILMPLTDDIELVRLNQE